MSERLAEARRDLAQAREYNQQFVNLTKDPLEARMERLHYAMTRLLDVVEGLLEAVATHEHPAAPVLEVEGGKITIHMEPKRDAASLT